MAKAASLFLRLGGVNSVNNVKKCDAEPEVIEEIERPKRPKRPKGPSEVAINRKTKRPKRGGYQPRDQETK